MNVQSDVSKTDKIIIHEDGIYFGMCETEYHSDPALGSTGIKELVIDPVEWQFKQLHGEDKDTPARLFGRALHCRVLEGKKSYSDKYFTRLTGAEFKKKHPDTLSTIADLKDFLSSKGAPNTKGNKSDLVDLALNIPGCPPLYDKYLAGLNAEGKEELTQTQWDTIEISCEWMQSDNLLSKIMEDGTLCHGEPEVSIFCTINGVRRKARYDRLLTHAIIDLKTFQPMFDKPIRESVIKAIQKFRYDLQCAVYVEVWHAGRALWKQGNVFGNHPEGFLDKVYAREHPKWVWVFVKKVKAPQPMVMPFRTEGEEACETFKIAQMEVGKAISEYKSRLAQHGLEKDWPPNHPADTITDECFYSYFTNRRA